MVDAMKAVMTNMKCATAARTLWGATKVFRKQGKRPGYAWCESWVPARVLTAEEEKSLLEYALGFPMTKRICKAYCWAIAKRSGRHHSFSKKGPSEKWWSTFRRRNPGIALRKADTLDRGRARMANETVMKQYFTFWMTLKRLGIKDMPSRVYNCDESGIAMDPQKESVLALTGIYSQQCGARDHITVHCCVNADGDTLPPMIIFEKAYPSGAYTHEGVPRCLFDGGGKAGG